MQISPAEQRNPSNPAIARAVDRSKAILEDFRLLTEDVVSLDGKAGLDRNDQPGHVVISQANLLPYTHRESRTFIHPVGSQGADSGYPTDPIYWAENHADVNATFDPSSKKVDALQVNGRICQFDQHESHGWLPWGESREVFSVSTSLANHRSSNETVELFADGSIAYNRRSS